MFRNNKSVASFIFRVVKLPDKVRFVNWSKLFTFTAVALVAQETVFKLTLLDRSRLFKLYCAVTAFESVRFCKLTKVGKLKLVA